MSGLRRWKRRLLVAGIVVGGLLALSPLFGLAGTMFGMTRAFATLGKSGIGDPQALSESIGTTLVSTALGLILCPIGFVLLGLCITFLVLDKPDWKNAPPPLPPHP